MALVSSRVIDPLELVGSELDAKAAGLRTTCTIQPWNRAIRRRDPIPAESDRLEAVVERVRRRRKKLPSRYYRDVAAAFAGAARGLAHARERGIVHRDIIKPSNLMLDRDGRIRVIDFGLTWGSAEERQRDDGARAGTLAYMSPEQTHGESEKVGSATDVYGLGVTLYELLTGRVPLGFGSSRDPNAFFEAIRTQVPVLERARTRSSARKISSSFRRASRRRSRRSSRRARVSCFTIVRESLVDSSSARIRWVRLSSDRVELVRRKRELLS